MTTASGLSVRGFASYDAYRDSGVGWLGDVPEHWDVKRLKFAATLNPTSSEVRKLRPDMEVSFVPMEAVGEYGGLDLRQTRELTDVIEGYTYFAEGDVVVAKITPCFENGKGSLATNLANGIAFGTTELHVLRCSPRLDRRFLTYLTYCDAFRRLGEAAMYGAGGQKRVPTSFLSNLTPAFPPLHEQRAISIFLDRETERIDTLIAKKRLLIERLYEYRTALIKRTVTRGLPPDAAHGAGLDPSPRLEPSGIEWLGNLPEHWQVKPLRRVVILRRGHDLPNDEREQGCVPVVSSAGISGSHNVAAAAGPAIVTGRYGSIGEFHLIEGPFWPLNTTLYTTDLCGNEVRFVRYLLMNLRDLFLVNAAKSAVPGVDRNDLHAVAAAVPPLAEQRAIADHLDSRLARISEAANRVALLCVRLQEYRSSLTTSAVTGRIDVRRSTSADLTPVGKGV